MDIRHGNSMIKQSPSLSVMHSFTHSFHSIQFIKDDLSVRHHTKYRNIRNRRKRIVFSKSSQSGRGEREVNR